MPFFCTLHQLDERLVRESLVPALLGDDEAAQRARSLVPAGVVADADPIASLREKWREALAQEAFADDFLASGVALTLALLGSGARKVYLLQDVALSALDEVGLGVLKSHVKSHGLLFADAQGAPLPGVPDWVPAEAHGSLVRSRMAGGFVPAAEVPAMRARLRAEMPLLAQRIAEAGRDPKATLIGLLRALEAAEEAGLGLIEASGVVGSGGLVPAERVVAPTAEVGCATSAQVQAALLAAGLAKPPKAQTPAPTPLDKAERRVALALADVEPPVPLPEPPRDLRIDDPLGEQIDPLSADDLLAAFDLGPSTPTVKELPPSFLVRARAVSAGGSYECRFLTKAQRRLAAFRGLPPLELHPRESARGFWARLAHALDELSRELERDCADAGVPVERVELGLTGTAKREGAELGVEGVELFVRARAWPWVIARREERLKGVISRAIYLWMGSAPIRGKVKLKKPRLDPLLPRYAIESATLGTLAEPLGRRAPVFLEAGPGILPELLERMASGDPFWQVEALLGLLVLRDRAATKALVAMTADPSGPCPPFELQLGRKRLRSQGPPHDDLTPADVAAYGLAVWTHQDRIGTTRPIRRDPRFWRRFFEEHGDEDEEALRDIAIDHAAEALCTGDEHERIVTAERLGERDLAGPAAAKALLVVLKREEPAGVVEKAIRSAAHCRAKVAVPALRELLDDPRELLEGPDEPGCRGLALRDHAARAILTILKKPQPPLAVRVHRAAPRRPLCPTAALDEALALAREAAKEA